MIKKALLNLGKEIILYSRDGNKLKVKKELHDGKMCIIVNSNDMKDVKIDDYTLEKLFAINNEIKK
ncbi:MAG: hypothetical protein ACRC41_15010 [Sarcina sp.]